MVFNNNPSSYAANMAKTLTFTPPRVDIVWDGQSQAVARVGLNCTNTAATYTAQAYSVSLADILDGEGHIAIPAGEFFGFPIAIPATVSGTVATLLVSGIGPLAQGAVRGWKLTATEGSAVKVLAFGRITSAGLNVTADQSASLNHVSGVTAVSCF